MLIFGFEAKESGTLVSTVLWNDHYKSEKKLIYLESNWLHIYTQVLDLHWMSGYFLSFSPELQTVGLFVYSFVLQPTIRFNNTFTEAKFTQEVVLIMYVGERSGNLLTLCESVTHRNTEQSTALHLGQIIHWVFIILSDYFFSLSMGTTQMWSKTPLSIHFPK